MTVESDESIEKRDWLSMDESENSIVRQSAELEKRRSQLAKRGLELVSTLDSRSSPLQEIELRLRPFLPADLYSRVRVDTFLTPQERGAQEERAASQRELTQEQKILQEVFEHLRTLQRILYDYTSRE